MKATVVVVTLNRSECVARCLACLETQTRPVDEVIVVDASSDDRTRAVAERHPGVVYLRNETGFGRMTQSRNIGLRRARGEVVAFVDDDAFAHPTWLAELLVTYAAGDDVGVVGGRALNNQPGEATLGSAEVGRLHSNGTLSGYFAADTGKVVEVDHVMGCNMSFRREVLTKLGGFRTDYPGISGVREDTDMCLRVKRLGYRILFNPAAVVDHVGAPQAKGQRFDWRYVYYTQRNHTAMLIRNFGLGSAIVWRSLWTGIAGLAIEFGRKAAAAVVRFGVGIFGTGLGVASGLRLRFATGSDPVRRDAEGEAIRAALSAPPVAEPAGAVA